MPTRNKIFDRANDNIADAIIEELRLQGHSLTGALERSIKAYEVNENGGVTLTAEALGYIKKLEEGIKPADIVIDTKTIAEMARYVQLRMGYTGNKAIEVAIAILKKQKREGNPTFGSYKYSETGQRTESISEAFLREDRSITEGIETSAIGGLDNFFSQIKSGTI